MTQGNQFSRRNLLKSLAGTTLAANLLETSLFAGEKAAAEAPPFQALKTGTLPDDERLQPLKDLDGYFPFTPSSSPEEWAKRKEFVQRQMEVACGIWPMPARPKIAATVHGKIERDDYTVEKVYFESFPGLYVTGSLYRPKSPDNQQSKKQPGILCPHGHWSNGRFHTHGKPRALKEIEAGAELYEEGGQYPLQARCVQLARMGCVVFHYDMLGYADSVPLSRQLTHGFAKQRPELSSPEKFGLFSAQSELHLINSMGFQTWNSIRALDWLTSLPEIDDQRLGITGASGGGTQTFMLTAIDDRIDAAFPAVMVSTAMQGGCTCENASYLRVNTGNIEFAAMAAPRPIAMSAANDWTRELETKGLPELKAHYKMMGVPERVSGKHFPFPHNYNHTSRTMMYEFFNKYFQLGLESPILEKDYLPLSQAELSVWNEAHPKPASDDAAEIKLLRTWVKESDKQIQALAPKDEKSLKEYRRVIGGALEVMIGRGLPEAKDVEFENTKTTAKEGYRIFAGVVKNKTHGEALPGIYLLPDDWNQTVTFWFTPEGKSGLFQKGTQKPIPEVQALLDAKQAVASADLLYQGEFLKDGETLKEAPVVKNPREFAGFTMGYNHPLFAQRVHDILTCLAYVKNHDSQPQKIQLTGTGDAAAWCLCAAALAEGTVDMLALNTAGVRFKNITEIRDPNLLPGAVKYGDVPGLLAICAPTPLWLAGEGKQGPQVVRDAYQAAGAAKKLTLYTKGNQSPAVEDWLR